MASNEIEFGTLHPDGTVTHVRTLKQSAVRACPFSILLPEHYREDGSCKCDDANERAKMVADWEYSPEDFAGIPLRP